MQRIFIFGALFLSLTGCATTTEIVTAQPGAKVVREADNKELGVTPYKHTTTMWLWESEKLRIEPKRGEAKTIELKRSEVDMLPMGGGACLTLTGVGACAGIPLILAGGMKLPEKTEVSMEKEPTTNKASTTKKTKKGEKVAVAY